MTSPISCTITLALCLIALSATQARSVPRQDIGIRDPFIYCDPATGRCYMYGTCGTVDGKKGFDVRETSDPTLQTWGEPKPAFRRPPDFWGEWAYWAPEVHAYKGKYYLFATFEAQGRARAVQILSADSPSGPFKVHSPEPVTSPEYFALDGTLYIDKKGDPWLVYSREWVSVHDGEMRAVRLKPDLTGVLDGAPDFLLFKASSAPWNAHWDDKGTKCWLTDGPQMLRLTNGDLVMAWSSNRPLPAPIHWGYAVGIARSTSGEIQGPWVHEPKPLYNGHAGHGQIFRHPTLGLTLSMHQPNNGGRPYPMFLHVYEDKGKLTMAESTPGYVQAYWRFEDLTPGHHVLPSIDILDSSGKGNHLRGTDHATVGSGSASVPAGRIPATSRLNLFCYDNKEAPKDSPARFLRTVDKPIDKLGFRAWTVEASIWPTDVTKPQAFLCRDPGLRLGLGADDHVQLHFKGQSITSRATLTAGKWYNLAAVCDGRRLRLYVDGILDTSALLLAKHTELLKGRWTVGCGMRDGKPADQFTGLMDEVRISNKALMPKSLLFARKAGQ